MLPRALRSASICLILLIVGPCSLQGQSSSEESPPCSKPSKSYPEAQCLNDLANYYYGQRRYPDEVMVLRRLVSVREKEPGRGNLDLALALRRLGQAFISAGWFSDAELVLKRALLIQEKALGNNASEVTNTLHVLGRAYLLDGKYADAQTDFSRALAIRRKVFPPGSPGYANVAESFEDLGLIYEAEGDLSKAEDCLKNGIQTLDKDNKPGPESFLIVQDLDRLGRLYTQESKNENAEALFKRALKFTANRPGLEVLAVPVLRDYADLLDRTDRSAEAKDMRARARAILAVEQRHQPAPVVVRP